MSSVPTQSSVVPQRNQPVNAKYQPGKLIAVGKHQVEIINYIAEGGFAQIYSVRFVDYLNEFDKIDGQSQSQQQQRPLAPGDVACLKRVIVHDEKGLNELRNEVGVMKKLRGAPNVVQYYDSNASRLPGSSIPGQQQQQEMAPAGFEILLLMELCPNGSLLDYMNQRLATKLSEQEVLKIMYDITLALSQMHYLAEPLIHRDIKIENVLVDAENNFKLCDFGSTSQTFHVVTTHQDIAILTQNIYVHTTPQYRSPEMIDLYRYLPINEKSDIWALGVLLYKLLFFTTPFEMTGQFAILHSKYEMPPNKFSSKLNNLIIVMLAENPNLRPNIYQVLYHICGAMGLPLPIADMYAEGPYNFQNYTHFQNKLQNIQFQMFELEQKRVENHGRLSAMEKNIVNDIFMSSFDIASKIPFPTQQAPQDQQQQQQQPPQSMSSPVVQNADQVVSSERLVSPTPDSSAGKSVHSKEETPQNEKNHELPEPAIEPSRSPLAGPIGDKFDELEIDKHAAYYPSAGELDNYIDQKVGNNNINEQEEVAELAARKMTQKQMSIGSVISDARTSASSNRLFKAIPQDAFVGEGPLRAEGTMGTVMQHRSNNPFPSMGFEMPSQQQIGSQQQIPQQQQMSNGQPPMPIPIQAQFAQQQQQFMSPQTPIDGRAFLGNSVGTGGNAVMSQVPGIQGSMYNPSAEPSRQASQYQASSSPVKQNLEYQMANGQAAFQQNFDQLKQQMSPQVMQQQPVQAQQPDSQQLPVQPQRPEPQPEPQQPAVPKRPSKSTPTRPTVTEAEEIAVSDSEEPLPPKVPPHPRRKDVSSEKVHPSHREPGSGKLKLDEVDVDFDAAPSRHHSRHSRSRSRHSSTHESSGVRRSASTNSKPGVLLERPTTESIDLDLDKLKRKSMDMKYPKADFGSDLKEQSIGEYEVLTSHQENKSNLDKQRLAKRNVSNGSITLSSANTNEVKKSVARARQSLDLDKARREALLSGDRDKRRSLFSMFRPDKKI